MKLEDKRIGPDIHRLDRKLSRNLTMRVKEAGLDEVTMMHGWIIRYLYHNREKDVYQKDIEKMFSVRRSTVTNLIQLMEKKGYVRRESVAADARLKKVLLTEKGIESHETIEKMIDHIEEELTDGISEEELRVFYEVIRKITDNVEKYTYDDAILRHRLALVNAVVKKSKISERSYICLKLAWLMRGKAENLPKDTENYDAVIKELADGEAEFTQKAFEGFKAAMSKELFPICGMDEFTFIYVTADLARKSKDYQLSLRLLSDVIVSRTASNKLKDRARDLKEIIKKERAAEQCTN